MTYLFYGLEAFLMDKELQKLKEKWQINEFNHNTYDLTETLLETIIEDASMPSLFGDQKLILVKNADIFTGSAKKNPLEHNLTLLEQYLEHPNPTTQLIFTVMEEKLDERKKIVKKIKEKGTVKEFGAVSNLNTLVSNLLEDYTMSAPVLNLFIARVGNDLNLLEQELEKLKTLCYENKTIEKEDVLNLVAKHIDLDIFKFIDDIISKRKEEAILTYQELMKRNEEPIKIIVMLANQIRIMYQTKELSAEGYNEKDIATELNIHPYRVKMALQKARLYTSVTLLQYLNDLADLDSNIKSGVVNKDLALELFILNV